MQTNEMQEFRVDDTVIDATEPHVAQIQLRPRECRHYSILALMIRLTTNDL
jgi:hypothetical protein